MGNLGSQYFKDILDEAVSYESNSSHETSSSICNPDFKTGTSSYESSLCTPKCKVLQCDPRSPTEGITRTPIEVLSVSPVQKDSCGTEGYISEILEHTPPIIRISKRGAWERDPRSPALGLSFVRTPIQLPEVSITDDDIDDEDIVKKIPSITEFKTEVNEDRDEEINTSKDQSVHVSCNVNPREKNVESESKDFVDQNITEFENEATCNVHEMNTSKEQSVHELSEMKPEVNVVESKSEDSVNQNITQVTSQKETSNTSKYLYETPKLQDKVQHHITYKENSSSHKKKMFSTPEVKSENVMKPKVRTPLGTLCGNNSPIQILREKQSNRVNKGLSTGFTQSPQFVRTSDHP